MSIIISKEFLRAKKDLPAHLHPKVDATLIKLFVDRTQPGLNFERIEKGSDKRMFSVRVDDTYRIILLQDTDETDKQGTLVLVWVDKHEEAYAWARSHRCCVTKTNGIQIYNSTIISEQQPTEPKTTLFPQLSDAQLLTLRIPADMIPYARSLNKKEDLYHSKLPADAIACLSLLIDGENYDDIVRELIYVENTQNEYQQDNINTEFSNESVHPAKENNDEISLHEALKCPTTLAEFTVIESEDELKQVMNKPLEFWRYYLHPTQRKSVEKDYSGSARIIGTAGTGKTVVAMHRARKLAKTLKGDERILFTTFTRNLAGDINNMLSSFCTPSEMKHIEVINLNKWVKDFFDNENYHIKIIYGEDLKEFWERAMTHANSQYSTQFYIDEWNEVIIPNHIFTQASYLKVTRNGRGTRLNRKDRIEIWKVFEAYLENMKYENVRDYQMAVLEATDLISNVKRSQMYKHIIVDESQDFSTNEFKLLRAIVGDPAPNDIFIVGDAHQRIYKSKTVLSEANIQIRGRSQILRINYRTTDEIRRYAINQLNGLSFDDLDNGNDPGDKCVSLLHGSTPELRSFSTKDEEAEFIYKEIKSLHDQGCALEDICIVARNNKDVNEFANRLNDKFKAISSNSNEFCCHKINIDAVDDRKQ